MSGYFYDAFLIEEHRGPLWFVINILWSLQPASRKFNTLRATLSRIPGLLRSNAANDVTGYLEELRRIGLVELIQGEAKIQPSKELRYFLASTHIQLTSKFDAAVEAYVRTVVIDLLGTATWPLFRADHARTMKTIYSVIRASYVPLWNELMMKASAATPHAEGNADEEVAGQLISSTEYFIIFHVIWSRSTALNETSGFKESQIWEWCRRIRELDDNFLSPRLRFLEEKQIVLVDGKGDDRRYKLNPLCDSAFREYSTKFLSAKITLRDKLQSQMLGSN